jgi:phospholipid/cholesterol/gamma-HCH transport system ATP-binding protein
MRSITLDSVTMYRGDTNIIDRISHIFRKGVVSIILGHSGSGKSSLLKLAAGLLFPTEGRVFLDDKDLASLSRNEEESFRKESSFMFEDAALWANRTVMQNVIFPLEIHYPKMKREEMEGMVKEMLIKVGYRDKLERRPSQISGGEEKMVGIARALIIEPQLLFIDAPLLNLDSISENRIIQLLREEKRKGKTIIMNTSSSRLTSLVADELLVLHEGKLVEAGPFEEIRTSSKPITREIFNSVLEHASSYDDSILDLLDESGNS